MTLDGWIEQWAATDWTAFVFEEGIVSYRAFARRITDTAAGLAAAGIGPGDRVGFCGLNRIEIFDTLFACARLGAILLPLNNRLTPTELGWQIDDADPRLLLTTDGFGPTLMAAAPDRPVRDLDADPFLPATDRDPRPVVAAGADLLMVYTSGTTGHPKGAVLTQAALRATVANGLAYQELTAEDRVIAPLPTFHVGGLNIQTLPALSVGAQVILHRRFDPTLVLADISRYRPTQTLLVPPMLTAVAALADFATTDLSCLRAISTGSSTVPEAVLAPYLGRGVPVTQVYGATETGPTSVAMPIAEALAHPTSCGRPSPLTELRIVDPETGIDRAPGTDGEIWLRGPNLFDRYWNNPEATAAVLVDGWYRTGDIGRQDSDGHVWITDRHKDVIITGGENVYPAELEQVFVEHPGVAEIAVVGRSDDRWGEIPVAVIVPAAEPVTVDELRQWSAGRLARFKQPHQVVLVEALPRTSLGKVRKHVLRDQLGLT